MARKKTWLDVDDYMNYREPNLPRSKWKGQLRRSVGFDNTVIKSMRDYSKCPDCGGTGNKFVSIKTTGRKYTRKLRMVRCDCEYGA